MVTDQPGPESSRLVAQPAGAWPQLDPTITAQAKYAKEVNAYVNEYIRFADLKAGAVLTVAITVAGALGKAIPAVFDIAAKSTEGKMIVGALSLSSAVAVIVTLWFSMLALIPRVAAHSSLNSFPDIAKLDHARYAVQVAALDEQEIVRNLSIHNVTISRVAQKKFEDIKRAVISLLILLLAAFAIIALYVFASTG